MISNSRRKDITMSMKRGLVTLCIFTLPFMQGANAAPPATDLLRACEQSLASGFSGIEGQLCTWYVRPCDCDATKPDLPPVCLPEGMETEVLAEKVVRGLKAEPALMELEADVAATRILVREFPCAN